ncbi:ethanolamine utilization cobalamin adenosyltransferase [Desulfohalotomaculum tongense]|uniref:cobalamin adenosyltransferase n=1 Tax=Desulforadius tongensis TaxID=1216062 RepID=UPI0019589C86|nr:cobalamin adenosyltransferase [Desulforadius tongensis]MBM7854171.1 ethanolamine utilization cobalamin adenosyltransferase [Desulforadius tongensis]
MKFITEMELRDLYKIEPFATYVLEPDTKITPGARQFLIDKRVTLVQAKCGDNKKLNTGESNQTQVGDSQCALKLRRKMEYIESLFFLIAAELLHSGDAVLSEEVLALGKCFRNVRTAEREQVPPENIDFWGWSEEEIKKRFDNLEKYVEISEFHVRLKNGKEMALLNHLRASLRELEPAILETYWNEEKQVCSRQDLIDALYLIINILCVMMWKCLGREKWKR